MEALPEGGGEMALEGAEELPAEADDGGAAGAEYGAEDAAANGLLVHFEQVMFVVVEQRGAGPSGADVNDP